MPVDFNKTYIGTANGGYKVYRVNGEYVRNYLDVEFIGGGHHCVHECIPNNEIWVEPLNSQNDEHAVLVHEIIEHILMHFTGMEYEEAHAHANGIEKMYREKIKLHK